MFNQGGSIFRNMPPVTKNLIIINFIVWLAMLVIPDRLGIDLIKYGGLHYITASDFNPAQLITYMFMHDTGSITHLFFNMFSVFMFGITLERILGSKRYLFYYISCGIGAALVQEIVWAVSFNDILFSGLAKANLMPREEIEMILTSPEYATQLAQHSAYLANNLITIGASGAVFGILLAFGMIFPNRPLYLMFIPIPIKAKWMVIGYGAIELFFGVAGQMDGVAHFAHLGGMIIGFFIIWYWKRKGLFNGFYY